MDAEACYILYQALEFVASIYICFCLTATPFKLQRAVFIDYDSNDFILDVPLTILVHTV